MYLAYLLPLICLEFRPRHEKCLEITRVPAIFQTLNKEVYVHFLIDSVQVSTIRNEYNYHLHFTHEEIGLWRSSTSLGSRSPTVVRSKT